MTDTADRTPSGRMGSILGTRVLRLEDPVFLTRGAVYTDDLDDERLSGAVHATFVRSPIAHARITSMDVSAAAEAPGVVAVLTAADLGEVPAQRPVMAAYPDAMAQPLLAHEVVRFVGEPVTVVLAEDRWSGEDAAELVEVDYEPLPVVVDPRDAVADRILLFPGHGTNVVLSREVEAAQGDGDLFAGCEVVVSAEIVNQRVAAAPLEVRAAAAAWDGDGRLTVWMPNQGAQGSKQSVRRMLGLDDERLRLITPDVGGAFGAKFGADAEHAVVALAARQVGRPVRWVETRSENMVAMPHGRGQVHTLTIGGDRNGRVR